jgi:hypothetical protein
MHTVHLSLTQSSRYLRNIYYVSMWGLAEHIGFRKVPSTVLKMETQSLGGKERKKKTPARLHSWE